LYLPGGFEEIEGNLYKENDVYDSIKKVVPDFSEEELQRNSY
jgi:hypothetical protein